jgi:hypothetical protein
MTGKYEGPSFVVRTGIRAAIFGLGLITGLGIARSTPSATAEPENVVEAQARMWAEDGPLTQLRHQEMARMAAMLKDTLELRGEQEVAFDRLHDQLRTEIDRAFLEIAPRVAETVEATASELRSLLTPEQVARLEELRSSGMFVPPALLDGGLGGG